MEVPTSAPQNATAVKPSPAFVFDIPPNNLIYGLGPINSRLHIYDTGHPGVGPTQYSVTILNVGVWINQVLTAGNMHAYIPGGNAVFVQNHGPSKLQALWT